MHAFVRIAPLRSLLAALLISLVAALNGISLLMLIPLLAGLGVGGEVPILPLPMLDEWLAAYPHEWRFAAVLGLYVLVIISYGLLKFFTTQLNTHLSMEYAYQLRVGLYKRLLNTPWRVISGEYSHQITNQLFSNLEWVMRGVSSLLQTISLLFIALGQFVVAIFLSPQLALFALVFVIASLPLMRWLQKRALRSGDVVTAEYRRIHAASDDFVTRFKQIKVHGNEALVNQEVADSTRMLTDTNADLQISAAKVQFLYELSAVLSIAMLFYIGKVWLSMPIESLLVFLFVMAQMLPRLVNAQKMLQVLVQALPAFESYRAFEKKLAAKSILTSVEIALLETPDFHCVQYRDITYKEAGLTFELAALDFKVGELVALSGPSGVGKTTLCDILAGLYPENCRIALDGQPLLEGQRVALQKSMSYVPQAARPWQATIREVLQWGGTSKADSELWTMLQKVRLKERVAAHSEGMDAPVGEAGIHLSGGELQRLMLAQALLREPRLLILDEISSALDAETEAVIIALLQEVKQSMAIVVATHRKTMAASADQNYLCLRSTDSGRILLQKAVG